jgi:spore germination protein GerM
MGFWSKLVILSLLALSFFYIKVNFFDEKDTKITKKLTVEEQIVEPVKQAVKENTQEIQDVKEEKKVEKTYVTVYFLGHDKNNTGIFKKVKRELPQGQTKLKYAISQLIAGPNDYEKKLGVYSEIPKNVKLLSIVESDSKIIINLSSSIQNGGGADSLYSRIKQIIKTSIANAPKKPIYLYIDGKKAEVLGGEGIMISQPLNENSLDG